jgi:hypothetical protein
MKARKFDEQEERVESGPIQFGNDWPGLFLRGDAALYYGFLLGMFLNKEISEEDAISRCALIGLQRSLSSCDARTLEK